MPWSLLQRAGELFSRAALSVDDFLFVTLTASWSVYPCHSMYWGRAWALPRLDPGVF